MNLLIELAAYLAKSDSIKVLHLYSLHIYGKKIAMDTC